MPKFNCSMLMFVFMLHVVCGQQTHAFDDTPYEQKPILYSKSVPTDPAAQIQAQIDTGKLDLPKKDELHGYLPALLEQFKIPSSSQVLVFSKTSVQKNKISPDNPRAIYFNDDVYVGWVRHSNLLEFASQDPQLGTIFYTMAQDVGPKFIRQTHNCLQCHDSSANTQGVPGLTVRSVFTDEDGEPRFTLGGFRTTYRSPFKERWGGWYVTGTHGEMRHMGNVLYPEKPDLNVLFDKGANLPELKNLVDLGEYLAPTSDIVALMTLEHQTFTHNLLTKANYETRVALLQNAEINQITKRPATDVSDGTKSRIHYNCDNLLEALLFCGEAPLTSPVKGVSAFAKEFEARGPFDKQGRSLRQFDLTRRMFKYPCSYLIYSASFRSLPVEARTYIFGRLQKILSGEDQHKNFTHLSAEDRKNIHDILRDTLTDLPAAW